MGNDPPSSPLIRWLGRRRRCANTRYLGCCDRCGPIIPILDDVLLHCQNSSTLESAHRLLQTLSSNPRFSYALDTPDALGEILEDMGFGGLWRSCSFNIPQEQDKQCFGLTEKLIEVRLPGTCRCTRGLLTKMRRPHSSSLSSGSCDGAELASRAPLGAGSPEQARASSPASQRSMRRQLSLQLDLLSFLRFLGVDRETARQDAGETAVAPRLESPAAATRECRWGGGI